VRYVIYIYDVSRLRVKGSHGKPKSAQSVIRPMFEIDTSVKYCEIQPVLSGSL
jgi:hypothetical protein